MQISNSRTIVHSLKGFNGVGRAYPMLHRQVKKASGELAFHEGRKPRLMCLL